MKKNNTESGQIGGNDPDPDHALTADRELKETRGRIADIVNSLPSGIAMFKIIDIDHISLEFVSKKGCEIFGYSEKEYLQRFKGIHFASLPLDYQGYLELKHSRKRLQSGEPAEFTFKAFRKDGTSFWMYAYCQVRENESSSICYATFQDVTEEVHARDAVRWRDERFRLLAEGSSLYTFNYDPVRDILTYSGHDKDGMTRETVIRQAMKGMEKNIFPEDQPVFLENLRKSSTVVCEGSLDYRVLQDGQYCWYHSRYASLTDSSGSVCTIVGVADNIQEKKEKEELLRARETAFITSVNSDAVLSLGFDLTTGKRIALQGDVVPSGWHDRTTFSEFMKAVKERMHPEDLKQTELETDLDRIARKVNQENGKSVQECRLRSLNGRIRGYHWGRIKCHYCFNQHTGHIDCFVMIEDIDREKRKELELLEQTRRDSLTGLLNRRAFISRYETEREIEDPDEVTALVLIDLDNFSRINREKGRLFGDNYLKQAALTLKVLMQEQDFCGRISGTTFAACMNGEPEFLKERIRILKTALQREIDPDNILTVTAGVSLDTVNSDSTLIYSQVNQALRAAKLSGGNCIVYYSQDLAKKMEKKEIAQKEQQKNNTEKIVQPDIPVDTSQSAGDMKRPEVFIRTFGYFDVFLNGVAILFQHKKAKELLALLIDRQGGYLTSQEAIGYLWENETANRVTLSRYRKVAMWLKNTLQDNGIGFILDNRNGSRRIVTETVKCDLYDYLSGKEEFASTFKGSYMLNYSWSEITCSQLGTYPAGIMKNKVD
ncbi:MAG: sensor domain-containing diguanylate cyclase [Eubacteriaceae bacterium]